MTSPFDRHRNGSGGGEPPRYVARSPQEEADLRNAALAIRNPSRAHEIEWYVTHAGDVQLRDKPSWTAARTKELARKAEQDRDRWKRSQERKDGNW